MSLQATYSCHCCHWRWHSFLMEGWHEARELPGGIGNVSPCLLSGKKKVMDARDHCTVLKPSPPVWVWVQWFPTTAENTNPWWWLWTHSLKCCYSVYSMGSHHVYMKYIKHITHPFKFHSGRSTAGYPKESCNLRLGKKAWSWFSGVTWPMCRHIRTCGIVSWHNWSKMAYPLLCFMG